MNKRIPFLIGFILLIISIWLQVTQIEVIKNGIERLNNIAYDMQLRADLLTHRKKTLDTAVVIVDVDDRSLAEEGRWPWPRSKLALIVDHLQAAGAVVIVFDMLFPYKENNIAEMVLQKITQEKLTNPPLETTFQKILPFFDNDAKFAASLTKIDAVVGVSFLHHPEVDGVVPPPIIPTTKENATLDLITAEGVIGPNQVIETAAKNVGFINVYPDDDGVIRRVPLLMRYKDGIYSSLALEAVRIYLLSKVELITALYGNSLRLEGIKMGSTVVPTDDNGDVIIPFQGERFSYPYFSATDVLHDHVPKDAFTGKIVFIGATAVGLGDVKPTSIQNLFPGIEINATIADGILKNNFPYKPAWVLGAEIFLTMLIGMVFLFIFPYFGPRIITLFLIGMPVLLIWGNAEFRLKTGLIVDIFIPMLLMIVLALFNMIYGYLFETRKREELKHMFGQYVPEKHIDEMLQSHGNYGLQGDDRDMTVLFADIRNFTTISEPLTASQLKELLNEFFTPMTEIIFSHRGTIDKYVGDLIMAFWGAPMKDKHHAKHALYAALDMQKEVLRLRPVLLKKWPEINIGIGLNSGQMSVGDMGSKFRLNYTVLGDTVNLASRVESLSKYYDAKIITTEFTEANQPTIIFRLLDRVRVKGKKKGVTLYEVICRKKELTETLAVELELHHRALDDYFNQKWDQAEKEFQELTKNYPHSKLYPLYLERIAEFRRNPPPEDWDGVYTHTKK